MLAHSALREVAQGQVEIKEQLSDLKTLCSQVLYAGEFESNTSL